MSKTVFRALTFFIANSRGFFTAIPRAENNWAANMVAAVLSNFLGIRNTRSTIWIAADNVVIFVMFSAIFQLSIHAKNSGRWALLTGSIFENISMPRRILEGIYRGYNHVWVGSYYLWFGSFWWNNSWHFIFHGRFKLKRYC